MNPVWLSIVMGASLILALAWRWRPRQRPEPGIQILLATYLVLGILGAFIASLPPAWHPLWLRHLEPSVLFGALAAICLMAPVHNWGHPVKAVLGSQYNLSRREWGWANLTMGIACAGLAVVNLVVAVFLFDDDWDGFKWAYMANVFAAGFLRASFVWVDLIARLLKALHRRWRARRHLIRQQTP
jgi:intracellular septation protein A